jgi:serine/threonine protein kinase
MGGCSSVARANENSNSEQTLPTNTQECFILEEEAVKKKLKKRLGQCSITDFEMGKMLGRGSCGTVTLAKHIKSGKSYAMKILSVEHESDLNQAMNELQIMLTVDQHPNIIRLEGEFRLEKTQYLIQEYAEGGDVFTLLRKLKRFNAASAQFYIAQTVSQHRSNPSLSPAQCRHDCHSNAISSFSYPNRCLLTSVLLCLRARSKYKTAAVTRNCPSSPAAFVALS